MTSPRALLAAVGRAAAIAATGAVLVATSVPVCRGPESATYAIDGSCGPAGEIALSFEQEQPDGCSGACWAFLEAPGAGPTGLPEQGEVDAGDSGGSLDDGRFALVGPVTLAGAPPRTVERTCRFTPTAPGVLAVVCTGDDPAAACSGTATRTSEPEPAP